MSELIEYKKNKINSLINIFNVNLTILNTNLKKNIINIQKLKIKIALKQKAINNFISQYNNESYKLRQTLNQNINNVNNFIPKNIIINSNKKALLIGINYIGSQNELYGCISDVNTIKERIANQGFSEIKLITDLTPEKPTREIILLNFKNLLINSQEGDLLFLLYSGHGSYALDRNNDEKDGYDELIVSCDFKGILDDELKTIIQTHLKPNVTLFAMFDSCFSGTILDLKYQYLDSLSYDNYTENNKNLDTQGNVLLISGCNDEQTSADASFNGKSNGAMTWSLLESLKQKPNMTWREIIKTMRSLLKQQGFDQIPQFSSGNFINIDTKVFV
jgi:hypothetical protein